MIFLSQTWKDLLKNPVILGARCAFPAYIIFWIDWKTQLQSWCMGSDMFSSAWVRLKQ